MARVSTEIKRLFVRVVVQRAKAGKADGLQATLLALASDQFEIISSGEICVARSGDGFSGTFSIPNPGASAGVTPVEIAALASELLDLYDNCSAFLTKCALYNLNPDDVDTNGWPAVLEAVASPAAVSDDSISTRMLAKLVPATSSMGDYGDLRTGVGMQWA